jgi:hypothetical protein
MKKYKITARFEDGRKESMVIDALGRSDALQYAMCIWDVEDIFVEKVED